MSAYVVIEFTVKDPNVIRDDYTPTAVQTVKAYGGEPLVNSNWENLDGEPTLTQGAMIRFPDHEAALAWYGSREYQQLIDIRRVGMDARFSLIG